MRQQQARAKQPAAAPKTREERLGMQQAECLARAAPHWTRPTVTTSMRLFRATFCQKALRQYVHRGGDLVWTSSRSQTRLWHE
eukprot:6134731-Amphidinium_carterae.2